MPGSRELKEALPFLLPFFIFFGIFILYPLIASFLYSLSDITLSHLELNFIGLRNYVNLLYDKVFHQALIQTIIYVAFHTLVGVPLGLGIALLFNSEFRGRTFARVCLLIPWATPPIVAATVFYLFFNPGFGPFTYLMERLGVWRYQYAIFGDPNLALFGLAVVSLWKSSPLFAFIFLSALQNVPVDSLESAVVYGASRLTVIRKIIIPFLKPVLVVNSILSGILSLSGTQAYDLVMGITGGGPGYRTYMLYFLSWHTAFPWNRLGYGSAMAYILTVISVIFALILIKLWYKRG
ncbi:MAG: sugar ABC transporter permease [Candidatus Bathyarchaeia archaeon]